VKASRIIPALVAGVAIGAAGTAGAATQWNHHQGGIWCKTASIQGAPTVLCVPESGDGYAVGINRNLVSVMSMATGRSVFARQQVAP
jgi:hypothetical protein